MTMTFHISDALLIERALFVAAMILIFGLISIGGLYLLRQRMIPARSPASSSPDASLQLGGKDEVETIARLVERLGSGRLNVTVREPQTQTRQEAAPSTRE
jgi:hypothetical protein